MYHGHFAFALLLKSLCGPSIPSLPILLGTSLLDLIGGLNNLLGLDILRPDFTAGPYMYTRFDFIDWDHSLLMMLVWSCLFGWILCHRIAGYSTEASMIGAATSVLHWVMDTLVIEPTGLTLYPHGHFHFGFGLYEKYPIGSWVLECALCLGLGVLASKIAWRRNGTEMAPALGLLGVLAMVMSPWTSPLGFVAGIVRREDLGYWMRVLQTGILWVGYGVPAWLFSRLIDGAEKEALRGKKRV